MPNYVTNVIELEGDEQEVLRLMEAVRQDGKGLGTFDFNKIIPMPESLNIEAGSKTDAGLKAYKEFISELMLENKCKTAEALPEITAERENLYRRQHPEIRSDEWELGRTAHGNLQKYNAATWYEWCSQNWNTKWPAVECEETDEPILRFKTAWNAPHPILDKLAEMYPDIGFRHLWADEDIGNNCGRFEYHGGVRTEEYYPETDMEGIEFAANVMQSDPADWGLAMNATHTGYINIRDDAFDMVELFDKPVLFSNGRFTDDDIPDGLYCYHLRESDGGEEQFCTLEKSVLVNLGGSIISKDPIDLGKEGRINFTEDNSPNFIFSGIYTMEDYLNKDFAIPEETPEMGGQTL